MNNHEIIKYEAGLRTYNEMKEAMLKHGKEQRYGFATLFTDAVKDHLITTISLSYRLKKKRLKEYIMLEEFSEKLEDSKPQVFSDEIQVLTGDPRMRNISGQDIQLWINRMTAEAYKIHNVEYKSDGTS